jgi:hypothetical protein
MSEDKHLIGELEDRRTEDRDSTRISSDFIEAL